MAIVFMEGFERNSGTCALMTHSGTIISTSGKDMSGSYCLDFSYGSTATITFPSTLTEVWVTIRWRQSTACAGGIVLRDSAGTQIASIGRGSNNKFYMARGAPNGTVLDTGDRVISSNVTYLLKIHYKPLNSGGQFDLYVDDFGTPDCTYTGDTTLGLEDVASLYFGYSDQGYQTVDDIIVSTTDITKNLRIAGKAISGAGTTTQWDPSTGANYECVNEVPPAAADYTSTNVTNEIDTFALTDCTEDINSIAAVQVELYLAKEGTPTPAHIQPVVRAGGTDYPSGVDINPTVSFSLQSYIWELNPNDSAAWEEADINALEIGYKATA